MNRRPARAWAALLGATLLWAAPSPLVDTSPAEAAPAFPPNRPTRVLVLGDSVMAGAAGNYSPALPGRDVTVDAAVNRTTGQGADEAAALGSDWDVVVILLGHNDGGSPGVYQPAARRLLDGFAVVPRVVWLTLHEVRPYYRDVNTFLTAEAARRPNLRIADWNGVSGTDPGSTAGDGLHLTPHGARLMAGLVADQVATAERDFAPPPPPPPPTTIVSTTVPPTTAPLAVLIPAISTSSVPRRPEAPRRATPPIEPPTATRRSAMDTRPRQRPGPTNVVALAVMATLTAWALITAKRRRVARRP